MMLNNEGDKIDILEQSNLENQIESEGILYFAGYLASKFPQHQRGVKVQEEPEFDWISAVARQSGKLTKPTTKFIHKMEIKNGLFNCFHGQTNLKSGKGNINAFATDRQQ